MHADEVKMAFGQKLARVAAPMVKQPPRSGINSDLRASASSVLAKPSALNSAASNTTIGGGEAR